MNEPKGQRMLILGTSSSGKTVSLHKLKNPEGVAYFNCDAGKSPSFPMKFNKINVKTPKHLLLRMADIRDKKFKNSATKQIVDIHTIVIDTFTLLMDMFITQNINADHIEDTRAGWGKYSDYLQDMMSNYIVRMPNVNIIFIAHIVEFTPETVKGKPKPSPFWKVPVAAKLKGGAFEGYFTNVVTMIRNPRYTFCDFEDNTHLNLGENPMVGMDDFYAFRVTPDPTVLHDRTRAPIGLFMKTGENLSPFDAKNIERYMDADAQKYLELLQKYDDDNK
jgi:hypothetical protein